MDALRVNGASLIELDSRPNGYYSTLDDIRGWLHVWSINYGQLMLCGWNVDFDRHFLDAALGRTSSLYSFRVIDLHSIAQWEMAIRRGEDLPDNFCLRNLGERLCLPPEPIPHRAVEGVRLVADCFQVLYESAPAAEED